MTSIDEQPPQTIIVDGAQMNKLTVVFEAAGTLCADDVGKTGASLIDATVAGQSRHHLCSAFLLLRTPP